MNVNNVHILYILYFLKYSKNKSIALRIISFISDSKVQFIRFDKEIAIVLLITYIIALENHKKRYVQYFK